MENYTILIAIFVLSATLITTITAILFEQFAIPIAASGIITFFGMLIISGYNKKSKDTKGIVRRAIASALIVSYIIAFSIFMFQTFDQVQQSMLDETSLPDVTKMTGDDVEEYMKLLDKIVSVNLLKMEFTNSLFVNFTNVIMVIIVFYFGSKGVLQYLKDRKPENNAEQVTQEIHNSTDNQLNKNKKQVEKDVEQTEKELVQDPTNETLIKKKNTAKTKLANFEKEESKPDLMCRAILTGDNNIQFESAVAQGSTLEKIIEDDKKYGVMVPKNGEYFTYQVMDWEGKWISNKRIIKAITFTWNKVEKIVDLEFREAKNDEYADFKIYFRKTDDDPLLTKNTLQYHFYPISDFNNENRGVCVVNADYPWTSDGEGIPLHIFDPEHYPNPVISTAQTIDFDAVYEHEGPGHGLGLPHSPNKQTKMYGNYSNMAESMFDEVPYETVSRLQAKYTKSKIKPHILKRWIKWFKDTRDRK